MFSDVFVDIEHHAGLDYPHWLGNQCRNEAGLHAGHHHSVHFLEAPGRVDSFPDFVAEFKYIYIQKNRDMADAWQSKEI